MPPNLNLFKEVLLKIPDFNDKLDFVNRKIDQGNEYKFELS